MQKLLDLSKKETRIVAGIMSGTSVDGIDVAIVKIEGNGTDTKIELLAYDEHKYPDGFKDFVIKNSRYQTSNLEDICRLNFLIPQFYSDAINSVCTRSGIGKDKIDLIGCHGQTIHHLPEKHTMYGKEVRSTLQIGSGSALAKLSGIPVISKFRDGDIALDGQGAPLVPYFDYIMYSDKNKNRALLNIGGISNFTILRKNGLPEDVIAFDTGPGNMLLDLLMKKFFGREFDKDGEVAYSGKTNEQLLENVIMNDFYVRKSPPKSTGREYYAQKFIEDYITSVPNVDAEDIIHTLGVYTAHAVHHNYLKFVSEKIKIEELFVSGGGAKNPFIMEQLGKYFGNSVSVSNTGGLGLDPDAKEAVCFAVLANEVIAGNNTNVPSVSGAIKSTILGEIALP